MTHWSPARFVPECMVFVEGGAAKSGEEGLTAAITAVALIP